MLSALALLLLAASSTHHVAAVDFQGFSSWLSGCSRQNSSVCTSSLALTLNFVYSQVLEKDWAPDEGAITAACRLCAQPLQSSFNSSAALANQQGLCPLVPGGGLQLSALSAAVVNFTCLGAAPQQAPGDGGGVCVSRVVGALSQAGLLARIRAFDPTTTFHNDTLRVTCAALTPLGCCARSWAFLMAALATQMCMPRLAHEYISLAGRCQLETNTRMSSFCTPGWDQALLPLLQTPAGCSSSPAAASSPLWLNGAACTAAQAAPRSANSGGGSGGGQQCFGNACDLWCALLGSANATKGVVARTSLMQAELPSLSANSRDVSASASPSPEPSKKSGLSVAPIVIICVFSVLIAVLLLALLVWRYRTWKEDNKAARFETVVASAHFDAHSHASLQWGSTTPKLKLSSLGAGPSTTPRYNAGPAAGRGSSSSSSSAAGTPTANRRAPVPAAGMHRHGTPAQDHQDCKQMGSHAPHAPTTDHKSRDVMEAPVAVTGFATMRSSPFESAGIATNNISHALATAAAANAAARSAWQGMPPAGGSRMSTPYFTPQEFDLGPDEVDRRVAAAAAAARELGARDSFSESEASYYTAVGMPNQQSNSSVRLPSVQAFDLNSGSRGGAGHSGGAGGLSWSPSSSVAGYHTAGSTGAYSAQSTGGSTGAHTPGQGRRLSDLETVLEH